MADEIRNSRFRYVDADDLQNTTIDFDDLDVRNAADDKLGDVDGFIVDAASGRPYYVVVNSGGWFSGGKYLVPINRGRIEHDQRHDEDVLRVNLDKDAIRNYPKFDRDEFARLSDDRLRDFETSYARACCPESFGEGVTTVSYETLEPFRQPDWWTGPVNRPIAYGAPESRIPSPPASRAVEPERERIVGREGQPVGDRAEPGDVLGIETGGEETHLGDTAKDERQRVNISDRETRQAEKNERG